MRALRVLVTFVVALSVIPVLAQTTWDNPLPDPVAYPVDSGSVTNNARVPQVVHEETIRLEHAQWMRLYFGAVQLGEGSILRITSLFDGEVQELDAAGLAMWSDTSAYFNGNELTVEIVAGPQTENRLVRLRIARIDVMAPIAGAVVLRGLAALKPVGNVKILVAVRVEIE